MINGQRGKLALFKLDDKSGSIDGRVDEALLNANKNLFKEDELIIVMGKIQPDRFSGGIQLTVTQVWDLEQARCRFGKYLKVEVHATQAAKVPHIGKLLKDFPAKKEVTEQGELWRGLMVRLAVVRDKSATVSSSQLDEADNIGAAAEIQLGEVARFYPSDAALASWRSQAHQGQAAIVYD